MEELCKAAHMVTVGWFSATSRADTSCVPDLCNPDRQVPASHSEMKNMKRAVSFAIRSESAHRRRDEPHM